MLLASKTALFKSNLAPNKLTMLSKPPHPHIIAMFLCLISTTPYRPSLQKLWTHPRIQRQEEQKAYQQPIHQ